MYKYFFVYSFGITEYYLIKYNFINSFFGTLSIVFIIINKLSIYDFIYKYKKLKSELIIRSSKNKYHKLLVKMLLKICLIKIILD